jgi:quinoprotein glucose dehydrogenase
MNQLPYLFWLNFGSKSTLLLFFYLLALFNTSAQLATKKANKSDVDWSVYASTNKSTKFSAVDQVNASNFKDLRVAWVWQSIDQPLLDADSTLRTWKNESTPLKIGKVLYTSTSLSQVAAIDAWSGKTIWQYNPETYKHGHPPNMGFLNRGLAYWVKGTDKRLYIATGDGYLIAINASTGKPVKSFGEDGKIDLTKGLRRTIERQDYGVTSPPIICNNTIIVGSNVSDNPRKEAMPPGDVRGFNVQTGKLLWIFESVPRNGASGSDTWEGETWKNTGGTNVWTWMSCDETLGYVYLPFGTPSNDFYGGKRHGDNLFAESLVALDVKTGKRIWHYQMVHHGLWDYDLPAAPVLADLVIDGKKRKLLAQITKQGFVFVLDRVNGKPIWPIDEKQVPASRTPGEKTATTQPFPTKPAPVDRQGIGLNDLIDFTPELKKLATDTLHLYDYGPLYTPPTEKGTVVLPGLVGGGSWSGAAVHPTKGILYVPSVTKPVIIRLVKMQRDSSSFMGLRMLDKFAGPEELPLIKPPYGRITAIDLKSGKHLWIQPVGNGPVNHPLLKELKLKNLGSPDRNHLLLTETLLLAAQEGEGKYRPSPLGNGIDNYSKTKEPFLRAFDPENGNLIGEISLPTNASGAPISYTANGRQFIVITIGGASQKAELIALTLPD